MGKRYILFQGIIDTLDLYTQEFVKILQEKNAECLVVQANHMDAEMIRLKVFLLQPVTAVISLNNIGMHLEMESGENIWECFNVPFYNILMDHPFRYKRALETAPKTTCLLCMDRNHVSYVKRFFPNINQVEFFPHAGIEAGHPGGKMLSQAQRPIDVIYAGSLSRYVAEGLVPDLGAIKEFDAFALVHDALESLIGNPGQTTEQVIEQILKDMNVECDDVKLGDYISQLRFLDSFAVSFYREQMIRALVEHGIEVTIFGTGWERCEWADNPNLFLRREIPPAQVLELMNYSKIVLNSMTWFKCGAHDRIFNGMLAGAAVVSDTSEYLEEQFLQGVELKMFQLTNPKQLLEAVKQLLEDPRLAQDMSDCGYSCAKKKHMWKHRLERVL